MQVSSLVELDTHVIVGGGQAKAFGISEDAEFFTILSDTLYRDKMRAVAREVTCNGWDAHIMAGRTDTPVEITITDVEIQFRDFGPGIPHDKIHPIYCIYGKSTKSKDGKQTGGFGLGSKSPFAYNDHLTVENRHAGVKTVNAISRGGVETGGKPDFREIVAVPTTESGVTVTIPLKESGDRALFTKHLREVAFQGGMLVKLNGDLLPHLDYAQARKIGFCVVDRNQTSLHEAPVYLLYGTVLYPISTTDAKIMERCVELAKRVENGVIPVLIAKPHTIGVQPSREGLSYSQLTTNTIHELLDNAEQRLKVSPNGLVHKAIQTIIAKTNRYDLTADISHRVGTSVRYGLASSILADPIEIVSRRLLQNLDGAVSYSEKVRLVRRAAQRQFRDDRRIFRRPNRFQDRYRFERSAFTGEAKHHSRRLILRLASQAGLLPHLFRSCGDADYRLDRFRESHSDGVYLDTVIIAHNQKDAIAEAKEVSRNSKQHIAVLVIPRKNASVVADVERIAEKLKLNIISGIKEAEKKVRVKPVATFYALSDVGWTNNGRRHMKALASVTEPKFFLRAEGTPACFRLGHGFDRSLAELYPGSVVVLNNPQEELVAKVGAVKLMTVLREEIEAICKDRNALYAIGASVGFIPPSKYYEGTKKGRNGVVQAMCEVSQKAQRLLFPQRVRLGAQTERAVELFAIASDNQDRADWSTIFAKLIQASEEAYPQHWSRPYLKREGCEILDVMDGDKVRKANEDLVFSILRIILAPKRKSTLTATAQPVELKDAA